MQLFLLGTEGPSCLVFRLICKLEKLPFGATGFGFHVTNMHWVDISAAACYTPGMTTFLADTSYLTASPYGLWGVVMVVFLLGLLCYNAWVSDAAERRRGYYVLAAALVLGLLILFALHFWQVDPMELFRPWYKRHGYVNRYRSYNALLFLSLAWIAVSWGIGYVLDKLLHRPADDDAEEAED